MEVADAHTYFAGELDVWAHNGRFLRMLLLCGQLYAPLIGEVADNNDPGIDLFELEFEETPTNDGPKRTQRHCPHYPPPNIRRFQIRDRGRW